MVCEIYGGGLRVCDALHCGIHDLLGEVVRADVTSDGQHLAPESLNLALDGLEALGVDATLKI